MREIASGIGLGGARSVKANHWPSHLVQEGFDASQDDSGLQADSSPHSLTRRTR